MHNKETKALFAVNPATEYSTLKRLRDFSRDANFYIGVDKDLAQSVQIARLGIELWRWILLVGILMLMGESILSKLLQ
jgi:hypothetical protein